MRGLRRSIALHVQNGKYYQDALNWHYAKFVFPFFERAWILVGSVIFGVLTFLMVINVYNVLPILQKKGLLVYTTELHNKSTTTTSLRDEPGYTQDIISKQLLIEYVRAREEYHYDELERQATHVKNNSSTIVYNNFYNYISPNNIDSPILKYKKSAKRTITEPEVTIKPGGKAIAKFKAVTNSVDSDDKEQEVIEESWIEAAISYQINDPEKIVDNNKDLKFLVTEYNSSKTQN